MKTPFAGHCRLPPADCRLWLRPKAAMGNRGALGPRGPRGGLTHCGRWGTGQARGRRVTSRGLPCLLDLRRGAARSSMRRGEDRLSRMNPHSCIRRPNPPPSHAAPAQDLHIRSEDTREATVCRFPVGFCPTRVAGADTTPSQQAGAKARRHEHRRLAASRGYGKETRNED